MWPFFITGAKHTLCNPNWELLFKYVVYDVDLLNCLFWNRPWRLTLLTSMDTFKANPLHTYTHAHTTIDSGSPKQMPLAPSAAVSHRNLQEFISVGYDYDSLALPRSSQHVIQRQTTAFDRLVNFWNNSWGSLAIFARNQ